MLFYSITGMHFIHVMITAIMIHIAIFYTKNTNINVPTRTQHFNKTQKTHYEEWFLLLYNMHKPYNKNSKFNLDDKENLKK